MIKRKVSADPLSDRELFSLIREQFPNDKECWEVVREAKKAYCDFERTLMRMEMQEERWDREYNIDSYAA